MTTAKSPAKKAVAKPAAHPPYKNMVKKAISDLKEKGGSSRAAIVKYIATNYKVGDNNAVLVKGALRRMIAKKELVHASSKSHGASGSFKLPAKEPKTAKPKTKKPKSPAKKAAKAKSPKKSAAPKPKAAKKSPAKKKTAAKKTPKKAAAAKK